MEFIVTEMMQKLGYDQKSYDADEVLAEIADVVPFFKGITTRKTWKIRITMASKRRWNGYKNFT